MQNAIERIIKLNEKKKNTTHNNKIDWNEKLRNKEEEKMMFVRQQQQTSKKEEKDREKWAANTFKNNHIQSGYFNILSTHSHKTNLHIKPIWFSYIFWK